MKKIIAYTAIAMAMCVANVAVVYAQIPQELRLSDRYIRIGELGEITDTVNVWGDVGSPGRYIVPEDISLPELVSFSLGYTPLRGRESDIRWAKTLIEIKVSRFNEDRNLVDVALFSYKYQEPEPTEMFTFNLQNDDIITLQVRRKPSFADYVKVIAPVVGLVATSVLLVQNLQ